jgi:hypothetical protein
MNRTILSQSKPGHFYAAILMLLLFISIALPACKNDDDNNPAPSYQQVNLVASSNAYGAAKVDTNLVNAWGVAISPAGAFWISSTEKDLTTVYDRDGTTLINPIAVDGEPTG